MKTLPYQPEIAERMTAGTDETIRADAQFYQTANGYWIAWQDGCAAVLPPGQPENKPCDWVEGMDGLDELAAFIESGEYADMPEFDGSDEEWAALCAHEHNHDDDHEHRHG